MPAAPLMVAIALAVSVAVGALGLAIDPAPFSADASMLILGGLAVLTVVAAAGVLLARGRWSRVLTGLVGAQWVAIGVGLDANWGLPITVAGAVVMAGAIGPWLRRWLRHLPSADGPPVAAVVLLLTLLATPVAIGWATIDGVPPAAWLVSGWALVLAFSVARAVPGALTACRVGHPIVSAVAIGFLGGPGSIVVAVTGTLVTVLAWRRDFSRALVPAEIRSEVVRMPPELTPPDVLEAAGLDESGRPRAL